MKTAIKLSLIAVVITNLAQAQETKRYEVKSAKIEYQLKSSGDMMGGMVKIKGLGKKIVIFDNYGLKELNEENKVTKNSTMGQTKVDKTHSLKYMNGSIVYSVQFKEKRIARMKNPMVGVFGGNATKTGEEMLKKMGGKKIGTDKVAGHSCDIWDLSGVKQCIYKGIPLRVESNIMGLHSVETATKAEFDLKFSDDDFKLPDYPVYHNGKKVDKSQLEKMDKKDNAKSKVEAKEGVEALKVMSVGIESAKKAGFDPKFGKDMTPAQEKAMQQAMMGAMMKARGGESAMVEKEKQEILKNAKNLPKAKKCFEDANSVKEANLCEKIIDGEDTEIHHKWDKKTKADLLKELEIFENAIPCIKKAEKMQDLQKCMN